LLDKVEKQIKKGKQKIRERRTSSKFRTKGIESEENITTAYEEPLNQVSVENIEYKPMDVEEAIMQMSLIKDSFLVFTNSRTDKVNVIYRRRNGQYGLIQPST
ncbi:MAG TPA: ribosome-associated translation inhibitor RaiA, partial [Bacteroidetes bacterium]|nr:ribosome-associated translation inhibitor RaiA [Bacteroidota bacterium]